LLITILQVRLAKEAAEAKKRAAEEKEKEEAREYEETKMFRGEDFNILKIPTAEELAAAAEAAAEEARIKREEEEEEAAAERAAAEAAGAPPSRGSTRGRSRASSRRSRTPGTAPGTAGPGGVHEEGEWESDDESDFSELTPLEARMVHVLERMKVASDRNAEHPRKNDDKMQYFMPMLFSDDIKYKNFETAINDQDSRLSGWQPLDVGKKHVRTANAVNFELGDEQNQFSDISTAVKDHKIKLVQDRLKRLYKTTSSEESPADWTEVVKKDAVAWVEFLDAQEAILMKRPPTPPPPLDEEAEFFKQLKLDALFLQDVAEEDEEEMSVPEGIPASLPIPSDAATKNVAPLPLGRVASGVIQPDSYAYYQLDVIDLSHLTLELKSIRGYSDLYLSKHELPTKFNYDHRVHAGDYNQRVARLLFQPKQHGTHFIGVHSDAGAKFEVWAFAAGAGAAVAKPLEAVNSKLRQWEIVSNHTVQEIDEKLPELMHEAKQIVDFENSMAMPTILADYKEHEQEQKALFEQRAAASDGGGEFAVDAAAVEGDDDDDMDEIAIMDTFISKAGRGLIRRDMHAGTCSLTVKAEDDEDDSDEEPDHIDPNSHPDLFRKPELKTRRDYLQIVRAEPKLDKNEINDFLNLSMGDRANGISLSRSLTSLPDLKESLMLRMGNNRKGMVGSSIAATSTSQLSLTPSRALTGGGAGRGKSLTSFGDPKPIKRTLPASLTQKIKAVQYTTSDRAKESRGDIVRREREIERQAKGLKPRQSQVG
jgi:hypothetical protein